MREEVRREIEEINLGIKDIFEDSKELITVDYYKNTEDRIYDQPKLLIQQLVRLGVVDYYNEEFETDFTNDWIVDIKDYSEIENMYEKISDEIYELKYKEGTRCNKYYTYEEHEKILENLEEELEEDYTYFSALYFKINEDGDVYLHVRQNQTGDNYFESLYIGKVNIKNEDDE